MSGLDVKAVVKIPGMPEEMQAEAIAVAMEAREKFNVEKDIASYIKREFDTKHTPTWHCLVGRNFGAYVTQEKDCYIYFYLGQLAVCLWKSA